MNRVVQKAERLSISRLDANATSFELCRATESFADVSVFRQLIESRLVVSRSAGQRRLLATGDGYTQTRVEEDVAREID